MTPGQVERFSGNLIEFNRVVQLEEGEAPTEEELFILSDLYRVNESWLSGGPGNEITSDMLQELSGNNPEVITEIITRLSAGKIIKHL